MFDQPNGGWGSRPKMAQFFAELRQDNGPPPPPPPLPLPLLPPVSVSLPVPVPPPPPVVEEDATSRVSLLDLTPKPLKALKRPKDLLLHIFKGRTVFETCDGQVPTEEHMAYINAYYSDQKELAYLNDALTEADSSDSDGGSSSDFVESGDVPRTCRVCDRKKSPSVFTTFLSSTCLNCTQKNHPKNEKKNEKKNISKNDQKNEKKNNPKNDQKNISKNDQKILKNDSKNFSKNGQKNVPENISKILPENIPVVPKKRGRKRKVTSPVSQTEFSFVEEKSKKVEKKSLAGSSNSAVAVAVAVAVATPPVRTKIDAVLAGPSSSRKRPVFEPSLDETDPAEMDPEVLRAARLIFLLERKPLVEDWNADDVGIFLSGIRGIEGNVERVRESVKDGVTLCQMSDLPLSPEHTERTERTECTERTERTERSERTERTLKETVVKMQDAFGLVPCLALKLKTLLQIALDEGPESERLLLAL